MAHALLLLSTIVYTPPAKGNFRLLLRQAKIQGCCSKVVCHGVCFESGTGLATQGDWLLHWKRLVFLLLCKNCCNGCCSRLLVTMALDWQIGRGPRWVRMRPGVSPEEGRSVNWHHRINYSSFRCGLEVEVEECAVHRKSRRGNL